MHALNRFHAALAVVILPGLASSAETESSFLDDMPMVLTASRIGLSPLESPAPVTVLDRETIQASGYTEIQDVLRLVPGFLVVDTPLGSPIVVNQGMGDPWSRRLQVLIDGSSVFDPLLGGINWEDLPLRLDDIERIEVVRSPNPSSYGANAFQGVVNIITRAPYAGPSSGVVLRAGKPGIADAHVFIARGDASLDWRLSVSRRQADNFRAEKQPEDEQYGERLQRDVINAQMTWRPTLGQEARFWFGVTQGEDVYSNLLSERAAEPRALFLQAAWRIQHASEAETQIQYYRHARQRDYSYIEPAIDPTLAPYPALYIDRSSRVIRDDLEIQHTRNWSDTLKTLLGAGMRQDQAESSNLLYGLGKIKEHQWQVFATADWRASETWALHAGAMVEKHYNTDTLFSPRLAANYRIDQNQSLRIAVGKGYRAPTIFETSAREATASPTGVADIDHWAYRDLEPESVKYFDLGYVAWFPARNLRIDARLYRNRYTNFIDEQSCIVDPESQTRPGKPLGPNCPFDPPAGYARPLGFAGTAVRNDAVPYGRSPRYGHYKAFYYFNSGDIDVEGADLSVSWRHPAVGNLRLSHAYTRIDASGLGVDDTLDPNAISLDKDMEESAPRHATSLLWWRELPWWGLSAQAAYYHVGKMNWPNGGADQPAYDRVDLTLTKSFGKPRQHHEIALTMQNLNEEYVEFREHLVERRVFLTLRLGW